jgi:hypothetical protein
VSDTDTAVVKSLKVLDPNRPIREADIPTGSTDVRFWVNTGHRDFRASCLLLTQSGHWQSEFAVMHNAAFSMVG